MTRRVEVALLVPVFLAPVEGREHDRHNHAGVVADQTHNVLVVPEVESPLRHLAVNSGTTARRT